MADSFSRTPWVTQTRAKARDILRNRAAEVEIRRAGELSRQRAEGRAKGKRDEERKAAFKRARKSEFGARSGFVVSDPQMTSLKGLESEEESIDNVLSDPKLLPGERESQLEAQRLNARKLDRLALRVTPRTPPPMTYKELVESRQAPVPDQLYPMASGLYAYTKPERGPGRIVPMNAGGIVQSTTDTDLFERMTEDGKLEFHHRIVDGVERGRGEVFDSPLYGPMYYDNDGEPKLLKVIGGKDADDELFGKIMDGLTSGDSTAIRRHSTISGPR